MGYFRRSLVWLPLGCGIQHSVHQVDLGIIEEEPASLGQNGGRATAVGVSRAKVDQRQEKCLQAVVEGLKQSEPQTEAF